MKKACILKRAETEAAVLPWHTEERRGWKFALDSHVHLELTQFLPCATCGEGRRGRRHGSSAQRGHARGRRERHGPAVSTLLPPRPRSTLRLAVLPQTLRIKSNQAAERQSGIR